MALPTLSSLSLQVAIKNWLLYDVPHMDIVPPMFIQEILRRISPWQLYRSSTLFKAYGFDTASVWIRPCSGSLFRNSVHIASKLHAHHSILYHLQENWLSVDDVLQGLAEECLEIGFHELIHTKDLTSVMCTTSGRAERVTEKALMTSEEAPTLFRLSLPGTSMVDQMRPQLADFLNCFKLLSPRKLEIRGKRFHRATFYWLPFIGPTLEDIEMSSWRMKYGADGVRLLDALMSYGVLKSVRASYCVAELCDWFRFLSVAVGHSVHCLVGFHAIDDDGSFDYVSADEPEYVWHSRPQLDVSKPAIPGLTCVCGPNMRQGLASFQMEIYDEHHLQALYSILPHWYNLEELELYECSDCPWLFARIARQTAAPYRLSKIRLTFDRGVNSTKLFHVLTSELGKYVSEQNSIEEFDLRFGDTVDSPYGDDVRFGDTVDSLNGVNLFVVPCIVFCEELYVYNCFSYHSFNLQIAAQIRLNTSLKRLYLARSHRVQEDNLCDMVIAGLSDLKDALLEELSLYSMRIGEAAVRKLMLSLSKMRHIRKLDLSCSLEQKALQMISNGDFLAALRLVPSLRVLVLDGIDLGADALVLLTSLINADGSRATQLQVLSLRHNGIHTVPLLHIIGVMHRLRQYQAEKLMDALDFGSLDLCKADEERYRLATEQLESMVNISDFILQQSNSWQYCNTCRKLATEHFSSQ